MLNLNTLCPSSWIYSAPGDKGQIGYFPKMHCSFRPRNLPGPKIFQAHGHSTNISVNYSIAHGLLWDKQLRMCVVKQQIFACRKYWRFSRISAGSQKFPARKYYSHSLCGFYGSSMQNGSFILNGAHFPEFCHFCRMFGIRGLPNSGKNGKILENGPQLR